MIDSTLVSQSSSSRKYADQIQAFTDRLAHEAVARIRDAQVGQADLAVPFRMTEDDLARAMGAGRDLAIKVRKRLIDQQILSREPAPGWFKLLREVGHVDLTISPRLVSDLVDLDFESTARRDSRVDQADLILRRRKEETDEIIDLFEILQKRSPTSREIEVVRKTIAGASSMDCYGAVSQARYLYDQQKAAGRQPWEQYLKVSYVLGPSHIGALASQYNERRAEEWEREREQYWTIRVARDRILYGLPFPGLDEIHVNETEIKAAIRRMTVIGVVEEDPEMLVFAGAARRRRYDKLDDALGDRRWTLPLNPTDAKVAKTLAREELREVEIEYRRRLKLRPDFLALDKEYSDAMFAAEAIYYEMRTLVARMIRWVRKGLRRPLVIIEPAITTITKETT